ncbi:MAG TPA: bifunctional precorrin-2 dehydrogenase/sirohydrochlorin ferrochelatase [Ktedonobacterales bacterium]|nr:bifunctional precorrin-2 dehydrogenase/sirohydrochlorin ferrochelatase [Ktedonobacterales bacterium]
MPSYYPIMLDIRDRLAIVIGGDRIAAEKAAALAASGARVTVLATDVCDELRTLASQPGSNITLRLKTYAPGDLEGAFVVVASTRNPDEIAAIRAETRERNQLLNVVDVPAACDYIVPSILRRGQLTIAVSTEGASPSLAKRIRQRLETLFPPAYAAYLRLAAAARRQLRAASVTYDRRDEFFAAYDTSNVLARLTAGDAAAAVVLTAALLDDYSIDASPGALEEAIEADE